MFLSLAESRVTMRLVYQLAEELRRDPEQVFLVRSLTLDKNRPLLGLKGSFGLFGSKEWWGNISCGVMPAKKISGVIVRIYYSGQDGDMPDNTMDVMLDEGVLCTEGIYVHDEEDVSFYQVGSRVEVFYVLDPLKDESLSRDQSGASKIVIEVAVSVGRANV
ncbi:hypothetical protein ACIOWK_18425 [Pseudomonas protegens]|uniref:hypothetical protein n=1 Tax=Pseudomonas protegens TaxID=380021 RepID=UPI00380B4628